MVEKKKFFLTIKGREGICPPAEEHWREEGGGRQVEVGPGSTYSSWESAPTVLATVAVWRSFTD